MRREYPTPRPDSGSTRALLYDPNVVHLTKYAGGAVTALMRVSYTRLKQLFQSCISPSRAANMAASSSPSCPWPLFPRTSGTSAGTSLSSRGQKDTRPVVLSLHTKRHHIDSCRLSLHESRGRSERPARNPLQDDDLTLSRSRCNRAASKQGLPMAANRDT